MNVFIVICFYLVQPDLIELHVKLLRKARRTVHSEKWERALVKFIHTYSNQDAWNLERLGYQKLKLTQRLLILKVPAFLFKCVFT